MLQSVNHLCNGDSRITEESKQIRNESNNGNIKDCVRANHFSNIKKNKVNILLSIKFERFKILKSNYRY